MRFSTNWVKLLLIMRILRMLRLRLRLFCKELWDKLWNLFQRNRNFKNLKKRIKTRMEKVPLSLIWKIKNSMMFLMMPKMFWIKLKINLKEKEVMKWSLIKLLKVRQGKLQMELLLRFLQTDTLQQKSEKLLVSVL